jgi:hypothetical protein
VRRRAGGAADQTELLCFWLLPRFVRMLAAVSTHNMEPDAAIVATVRDALVTILQTLCGPVLLLRGGIEHARTLLLEMLELCKGA